MFIVCLTIFSSILSPLQSVSYVKVHVYCVFDYFLFNLVSTSGGELRESVCSLYLHCIFIVCLTIFSSTLSPLQVSYVKVHVYLCLTIFYSILSPLQLVSYVKVHVHCMFDYFLFNLVSTSAGELRESACLLCV